MHLVSHSRPRRNGVWIIVAVGCTLWTISAGASSGPQIAPTSESVKFVTPDIAMTRLQAGNKRFATGQAQHPHADAARLAETARGQHPFATILTCSDSRLSPEILFDQGIGDIFTVRVAGNVSDTDGIGTIEYGVGHLQSPLLVVMGHSGCEVVKVVASEAEGHDSSSELADSIAPAAEKVHEAHPDRQEGALTTAAAKEKVWQSVSDLFRRSKEVRERVHEGKLKVVGAVYDIRTGAVSWMGAHPQQAALLETGEGDHEEAAGSHEKTTGDPEEEQAARGGFSPLFILGLLVGVALVGVGFVQYRGSARTAKGESEEPRQMEAHSEEASLEAGKPETHEQGTPVSEEQEPGELKKAA